MVKNDRNFNVYAYPSPHTRMMFFNLAKGPCQDLRVRKAISHAIDRKALIAGTQFGLGRLASCLYPDNHWCHNPELPPVAYDPELSKKLLAEAGHGKGLVIIGGTLNTPTEVSIGEAGQRHARAGRHRLADHGGRSGGRLRPVEKPGIRHGPGQLDLHLRTGRPGDRNVPPQRRIQTSGEATIKR